MMINTVTLDIMPYSLAASFQHFGKCSASIWLMLPHCMSHPSTRLHCIIFTNHKGGGSTFLLNSQQTIWHHNHLLWAYRQMVLLKGWQPSTNLQGNKTIYHGNENIKFHQKLVTNYQTTQHYIHLLNYTASHTFTRLDGVTSIYTLNRGKRLLLHSGHYWPEHMTSHL